MSRRHERLTELFLAASELQGAERAAYLERECGADEPLRARVEAMLAQDAADGALTTDAGLALPSLEEVLDAASVDAPRRIGRYVVEGELGRGGMAIVYAARQDHPAREVALKLLAPGMTSAMSLRRFEFEVQALGQLEHPRVARIYEADTTDLGRGPQPYFAMERIRGWPLVEHASREQLSLRRRVELFREVCEGVQHAHQKGIVHRDLKPDNVLVDARGGPKVLDFGIARVVDEDAAATRETHAGQVLGTLGYMSPEQAGGDRLAVDARSDVYSLGVMLYELLSGHTPIDVQGLPLPRALLEVRDRAPAPLGSHDGRLSGDLETITHKALAKEPERRYASAEALSEDLGRYLRSEPIAARPPSAWYQLERFARRNKVLVGAAAAVLVTLVAGLWSTLVALDRAEQRTEEVFRLSALQDYAELIERADRLWPAHPENIEAYEEWIRDARALVAELPAHRAKLDELRAMALPRTEEFVEAARRAHPAHERFEDLGREIAAKRAALVQRRDDLELPTPEVDLSRWPTDVIELNRLAQERVYRERHTFGLEAEGLALAMEALGRAEQEADDALVSGVLASVAQALSALGRDEESLEYVDAALLITPDEMRQVIEGFATEHRDLVEWDRSEEGLDAAAMELHSLQLEQDELAATLDEAAPWAFPPTKAGREAAWWYANLIDLTKALTRLEGASEGLLSAVPGAITPEHGWSVPHRLELARELEARSAPGTDTTARWADALRSIQELPVYGGLKLEPQEGLVPLGRATGSGLWEFWHVQTGTEPDRDELGEVLLDAETGLIMVLLPGGVFRMGAQGTDPAKANYDPRANADEQPVREVRVSPFFISKYEMTQAQWRRVAGSSPSPRRASISFHSTARLPVETISWDACRTVLLRSALDLPSEAQWEYSARAGTQTPFSCAEDLLWKHENLADRSWHAAGKEKDPIASEPWDDGHGGHAPVGSLAPNPFGLHDVHGNVAEWCLDGYAPYDRGPQVDPVTPFLGTKRRVRRGGCLAGRAIHARSSMRYSSGLATAGDLVGVRPARSIR